MCVISLIVFTDNYDRTPHDIYKTEIKYTNTREGHSLDQIKMTEWIWPNHDNDEHYLLNMTEIAPNLRAWCFFFL